MQSFTVVSLGVVPHLVAPALAAALLYVRVGVDEGLRCVDEKVERVVGNGID